VIFRKKMHESKKKAGTPREVLGRDKEKGFKERKKGGLEGSDIGSLN